MKSCVHPRARARLNDFGRETIIYRCDWPASGARKVYYAAQIRASRSLLRKSLLARRKYQRIADSGGITPAAINAVGIVAHYTRGINNLRESLVLLVQEYRSC